MQKVVIGLSGGVDSAVAASLLTKEYEVYGVTLQMQGDYFDLKDSENPQGRFSRNPRGRFSRTFSEEAGGPVSEILDAIRVSEKLGIHHEIIDCSKEFEGVKAYFAGEYLEGRTPNPCVLCNPAIKWKALLDYADSIGAEYVATGHYAYIDKLENGRYAMRAADSKKDQTYVLYGLTQEQLARTIMPLGSYDKTEVRQMAAELGLAVADKPDSMEICFVPDGDYTGFISEFTGITKPEGNFVDEDGKVLARHKGITHYTVGQRKGLGVAFGAPMYVKEIRPETDEVVLSASDIYSDTVSFGNVRLMGAAEVQAGDTYFAKVRYSHKVQKCSIISVGQGEIPDEVTIGFESPVRAATPGQSAVLYDELGRVMLGGIIKMGQ